MKVVIDSAIPYLNGVLEPYAEVLFRAGSDISKEDVATADALIVRTRTRCSQQLLEGSSIKFIATATIGFDHIDLDYCQRNGIEVVTAAGCNAAAVLQWVAAVLCEVAAIECWHPSQRTLGIVGVGNVGSLVEQYARAWGFRVLRCDPPRQLREKGDFISLEELAEQSDIITFHTPLDATTHHLLNDKIVELIPPHATIINASRGEVASTESLLKSHHRLALDVWEREPFIDNTLLEKAFISTPHIAGYSAQGKANASAMSVRALARYFSLPLTKWYPHQVTPTPRQEICWEEMCRTIREYCDLRSESLLLKRQSDQFEALRNNYNYRKEYF